MRQSVVLPYTESQKAPRKLNNLFQFVFAGNGTQHQEFALSKETTLQTNVNLAALDQRLNVVCRALNLNPSSDEDRYERFVDALKTSGLELEKCIYVLYQLFLARIPITSEIQHFVALLQEETTGFVVDQFVSSVEFRACHQSRTHFLVPCDQTPLIEVTHTVAYPFNTGIQRVVRSLAAEIKRGGKPHSLIEFDPAIQNYRMLDDASKPLLYAWNGGYKVSPVAAAVKQESRLKKRLRKTAGRRLCKLLDGCFNLAQKSIGTAKKTSQEKEHQPTEYALFLWNHKVLFPELVVEPRRIEIIRIMLENTSINSTIIVFDMIPFTHPEFFVDSTGYVHYLTLLRCVDRVSCISRAVEENVRALMPLIQRKGSMPEISTHYLGADFGSSLPASARTAPDNLTQQSQLPIILAVGTIEVRKNHRRIMRAMAKAQKLGYQFRGVFAGSPGWLSEAFLGELKYYQSQGYDIELTGTVSEAQLEQLYNSAKFTIYGSLVEGFGLPIVESVVRGVPCIASNRGCMREIAEQIGGCLLIDPESEESISQAIMKLFDSPETFERLRLQASQATWRTWRDYADDVHRFATKAKSQGTSKSAQIAA